MYGGQYSQWRRRSHDDRSRRRRRYETTSIVSRSATPINAVTARARVHAPEPARNVVLSTIAPATVPVAAQPAATTADRALSPIERRRTVATTAPSAQQHAVHAKHQRPCAAITPAPTGPIHGRQADAVASAAPRTAAVTACARGTTRGSNGGRDAATRGGSAC